MAKFGINDILNAKTKAAGQQAQTDGYKEIARRAILYMMITARRYIPQQGSRQAQAFRLACR